MGVLVSNKLFPITLKYAEVKLKNGMTGVVVIDDPEKEKKYEGKIKELNSQWHQPSFKENNEVLRQSMVWDELKGSKDLDIYIYRQLALEKFLKGWDIVDDENKPVPCTKESINKLEVSIANNLIEEFMARNLPIEEEIISEPAKIEEIAKV